MRALITFAVFGVTLAIAGCAGSGASGVAGHAPRRHSGADVEKRGAVRTYGDRDKEVVCERAMPTGSHIMRTICFPRGWLRTEEQERRRDQHLPSPDD